MPHIPHERLDEPWRKHHRNSQEISSEDNSHKKNCQLIVDNSGDVLEVLKKLFFEQEMFDVFLVVGNKEYGAHRIILCISSEVFQAMLMKPEWSECKESRVELLEMAECEPVFPNFLEYFYTGKIIITSTNVLPILTLADKYLVKNLTRTCLSYMCKYVPQAAYNNQLSSWLKYSTACGHDELLETCRIFIKWNFEFVTNTPDFNDLDVDTFVKILEQNDVVVESEMALYNCVLRWLDQQKVKLDRQHPIAALAEEEHKNVIDKITRHIRFPMISFWDLTDLLISPIVGDLRMFPDFDSVQHHDERCAHRMAIGLRCKFGIYCNVSPYYTAEERSRILTPRLYTVDGYNGLLTIKNANGFRRRKNYRPSSFISSNDKIVLRGTLEIPEDNPSTVRLSLTYQEISESNVRVRISIVVYGMQGLVQHAVEVREAYHNFSEHDNTANVDDLIPFREFNKSLNKDEISYLVGPKRNKLNLVVIVTPVT